MSRLSLFLRTRAAAWRRAPSALHAELAAPAISPYWLARHDLIYFQHVYLLARIVGRDAKSVIDVGSNECRYLEWLEWIPRKMSLDLARPYRSAAVEGIQGDILTVQIRESFDLCLCLQVLEHIADVKPFAARMLALAPHLIISVPYKWPAGRPDHVHDPVDEAKLRAWFGRDPNFQSVASEPLQGRDRLVCYYDRDHPDHRINKDDFDRRVPSKLL